MPKLLKILDELEAAIPDMRSALEGNDDYMAEGEEEELPADEEVPEEGADEEMPPLEGEEDLDLDAPPPFPPMMKKKKSPF
jgi:hypothetical protein